MKRFCSTVSLLPFCLAGVILTAGLAGCAGYQLGPTTGRPAGSRTVQVDLFSNETPEPRLSAAVGSALRQELQQDGTYRLNTTGDGDIIVSGNITRFDRQELTFRPDDLITVRDYQLSMTAHVTARERITGETLLDREVTGSSSIRVGADLASAERQAVPLMAEDLARRVKTLLVDGTW